MSRLIVALYIVLFSCVAHGADIEEGKVLKYYSFDPKTGVIPEGLPALTIEDLRKITLYSELNLKGGKLEVADKKHMRRIDPWVHDPSVLAVTSDHFRFSVLRSGVIDPKALRSADRGLFRFFWIKHVTHESPDGTPWLKDLILIPIDPKEKKLASPWPLGKPKNPTEDPFFLNKGDPRPEIAKVPPPEASIVGTFADGKSTYLVLDVFGNYTWWGKVTQLEFVAVRGAAQETLDAFHKDSKLKTQPSMEWNQWRLPNRPEALTLWTRDLASQKALIAMLPEILELPLNGESKTGREDLLRLELDNEPVKAIDDQILSLKTFGALLDWGEKYLSRNRGRYGAGWYGSLAKRLEQEDQNDGVLSMRVVRYGFRRMGFPAQILGTVNPQNGPEPLLRLHVPIPSKRIGFLLESWDDYATCFTADSAIPYSLRQLSDTQEGKFQSFEIPRYGDKSSVMDPVPRK